MSTVLATLAAATVLMSVYTSDLPVARRLPIIARFSMIHTTMLFSLQMTV
jgi:hypothetical protein